MMSTLHLLITTPARVLVDEQSVCAVRATDGSGSFGILPRHANLITVLVDSVVRWRDQSGLIRYCAVINGVFMAENGHTVRIACREGLAGNNLKDLQALVQQHYAAEQDANQDENIRHIRLHTQAMRQIVGYLQPTAGGIAANNNPFFESP